MRKGGRGCVSGRSKECNYIAVSGDSCRNGCEETADQPCPDLLPGAGFLTLSYISREQVGYGDGLLLLTVGIWLGFGQTFGVLTLGLILCSVLCGVLLMRKKIRKQDSIPLVPFLLLGFVGRCGML